LLKAFKEGQNTGEAKISGWLKDRQKASLQYPGAFKRQVSGNISAQSSTKKSLDFHRLKQHSAT
jgi:hypothetical protein